MRLARTLFGTLVGFFIVEILVFHTNVYPSIVSTSSTTGLLETFLHNERRRTVTDRNQVLAIGDGPDTDINGAVQNNLACVFISDGINTSANPEAEVRAKYPQANIVAAMPELYWH